MALGAPKIPAGPRAAVEADNALRRLAVEVEVEEQRNLLTAAARAGMAAVLVFPGTPGPRSTPLGR